MTVGMSSTNFWAIGLGSDPWAAGRRPFKARDRVYKGRKMMKIGLKPTQNGVWGASNPDILKGRGRMEDKNALPIGCEPGGGLRQQIKRPRSTGDTLILPIFWSIGVQIGFQWASNPKGKVARGPMYLKNQNTAGYEPVGGLRKQIKRLKSTGDTLILPIFWSIGVQIGF